MIFPTDSFLVNLASNLAYDLIKRVTSRLYNAAFGDEEQQALRRAYEHAFTVMLTDTMQSLDADLQGHVGDILRRFIGNQETANLLLDIALIDGEPPLEDLRAIFETLGFDSTSLPVNFDAAITTLVVGLAEGLRREATQFKSALFNRVSLGRLTAMQLLLEENKQTWGDALRILRQLEEALENINRSKAAVAGDGINSLFAIDSAGTAKQTILQLPSGLQSLAQDIYGLLKEGEKAKVSDQHTLSLKEYLRALLDYCNQLPYVTLPGKPLPLVSTIYIEQRSEEQVAPDDLENEQIQQSENRVETIGEALLHHRHLIIEGGPGMGKSTMLHHLSLTLIKDWQQGKNRELIPVRIFARNLVTHSGSLSEGLHKQVSIELGKRLHTALPPNIFAHPPSEGTTWLVMLDGLDEIISQVDREELIHAITLHTKMEESCYRFIITTRPLPSANWFDRTSFGYYVVLPFEPGQVRAFAQNWFANRQGTDANDATQFLSQVDQSRIKDIARIPLLVTMAIVVYERDGTRQLPERRIDLYSRFVKILLEDEECVRETRESLRLQWDKRYGHEGRLLADTLFNKRSLLLEHLAEWQQKGYAGSFTEESLRYAREQKWITDDLDASWVYEQMENLLRRTGLLITRGDEETFIHTSFREYLAACALARLYSSEDQAAWSMLSHLAEENWWEIAVFLLGVWSRDGQDVTQAVRHILNHHGEAGLFFTGTALAEGARIAQEMDDAIVEQLLASAKRMNLYDLQNNPNPLIVLAKLRGREQVVNGLLSLACNSRVNVMVGEEAAHLLVQLGALEVAIKALLFLATENNVYKTVRKHALKTLGGLDKAPQILSAFASDSNVDIQLRIQAAKQLYLKTKSEEAFDFLYEFGQNQRAEATERLNIARILMPDHPERAASILLCLMHGSDVSANVKTEAAEEMGKLKQTEEPSLTLLALCGISDNDITDRILAAHELNQATANDYEIDAWFTLIYNPAIDISIRLRLLEALFHIGLLETDAAGILLSLAKDSSISLEDRIKALKMLEHFGQINSLFELAIDHEIDKVVCKQALKALGYIGDGSILSGLNRLAHASAEKDIRRSAQHAIGHIRERIDQAKEQSATIDNL